MIPAHIQTLITEDGLQLDAILFGEPNTEIGFVFVHGLSSSAFSHYDILPADSAHLSLSIHNRGHDEVTGIKRVNPNTKKGYEWYPGGKAHEIFTECVYDIQAGIDYLKTLGIKQLFLIGHSTGCQKSIYYLSRTGKQHEVSGAILICPMSDYAFALHSEDPQALARATRYARKMVENGKSSALLPSDVWPEVLDAQRFLSLYTPESVENIFTYAQPEVKPDLLQNITVPLLILIAENDEYADRPTSEIADWFTSRTYNATVHLIEGSLHGLTDKSDEVRNFITNWLEITTF